MPNSKSFKNYDTMAIFGVVFLNSYYSVWDMDNLQISFTPNLETTATVVSDSLATDVFVPISSDPLTMPFNYKQCVVFIGSVYATFAGVAVLAYYYYFEPLKTMALRHQMSQLADEMIDNVFGLLY